MTPRQRQREREDAIPQNARQRLARVRLSDGRTRTLHLFARRGRAGSTTWTRLPGCCASGEHRVG